MGDKESLPQIAEIAADLEKFRTLRPALQVVKTTIPKDIQTTVSHSQNLAYEAPRNFALQAFRLLQKSRISQHAELVSIIVRIHTTVNQHLIENVVMECLGSSKASIRGSIAAFSVIWNATGEHAVRLTVSLLTSEALSQMAPCGYHWTNQCSTFSISMIPVIRPNSVL